MWQKGLRMWQPREGCYYLQMHDTLSEIKTMRFFFNQEQQHTVLNSITLWGSQTVKIWTNYSEWHWKTNRLQFNACPLISEDGDKRLWQIFVLTSPKCNLCLSVRVRVCARVYMYARVRVCVCIFDFVCTVDFFLWWIAQLWGSRLTSCHPANSHWSLPPLSFNPTLPAYHLANKWMSWIHKKTAVL